jgi:hypothetical protein
MYNRYRIVNEQDIREGLVRTQHYLDAQQAKIVQIGQGSDTATG